MFIASSIELITILLLLLFVLGSAFVSACHIDQSLKCHVWKMCHEIRALWFVSLINGSAEVQERVHSAPFNTWGGDGEKNLILHFHLHLFPGEIHIFVHEQLFQCCWISSGCFELLNSSALQTYRRMYLRYAILIRKWTKAFYSDVTWGVMSQSHQHSPFLLHSHHK